MDDGVEVGHFERGPVRCCAWSSTRTVDRPWATSNWIRFSNGTPAAIRRRAGFVSGVVHAENFDNGGEAIAYHDTTAGNSGGQYRGTDVDIQPSSLGGYNVGWTSDGEWLSYSINVTSGGPVRVADPGGVAAVHRAHACEVRIG